MRIKFSIIVPIYNCEKYIKRLIDSVLNQSVDNYELILVDDGSKDKTKEIISEYKDRKIKYLYKKNTGVSDTRNYGIKNSSGNYILFLDADDYIDNKYLETIVKILNKYPKLDMINFGFYSDVENDLLVNKSRDSFSYKRKFYDSIIKLKKDFVSLWDASMLYNIWNKVYKRSIIEKNGIEFPKMKFGEDVIFNMNYLDCINNFYNSEKKFYHYVREREGATTKKYNPKLFDIRKNEYFLYKDYFEKWGLLNDEAVEFASRRYIERLLGCLENVVNSNKSHKSKRVEIKKMINDSSVREALTLAKLTRKKTKIMMIPVRLKNVSLCLIEGKFFSFIKRRFPSTFNKLKNRR